MSSISSGTTSTTTLVHSGDTTGSLVFKTNDTGSGGTTAMTIDTSQNVGIGTSSPATKLQVAGGRILLDNAQTYQSKDSGGTARDLLFMYSSNDVYLTNETANNLILRTNATERMRIDSSGNLLVGTTSTSGLQTATAGGLATDGKNYLWVTRSGGGGSTVDIGRTSSAGTGNYVEWWYNGSNTGTVSTNGSTTSYNTSSDYRLKHDIQPMTGALAKVAALKPVTYKWNADNSDGEGFIAHELQEVVPEAVTGAKDAINEDGSIKAQGIDTSFLVATLTAAIQELKAINDTQAQTITALTARIVALEKK